MCPQVKISIKVITSEIFIKSTGNGKILYLIFYSSLKSIFIVVAFLWIEIFLLLIKISKENRSWKRFPQSPCNSVSVVFKQFLLLNDVEVNRNLDYF